MATRLSPITYRRLTLSVTYRSVLFPFDIVQFARALQQQSYILNEALESVPMPSTIQIAGPLARRGDIAVAIDPDRRSITVFVPDTKTASQKLSSLEDILQREFGLNSASEAYYYELIAHVSTFGRHNPITTFNSHFNDSSLLRAWSEIVGDSIAPFGLRLAPRGEQPNQVEWFDFRIEPVVSDANRRYNLEFVYRSVERVKVFDFTKSLSDSVRELIAAAERESEA